MDKYSPRLLLLVSATVAATAYGDATFSPTSGDWMNPANWSTGALPAAADIAKIGKNDGNPYSVSLRNPAAPQTIKALWLGADNRTPPSTLAMENAQLAATSAANYIGYQGTAILAATDSVLDFSGQDLTLSRADRDRCVLALTNSTLSCKRFFSNYGGMSSTLVSHSTLQTAAVQFGQQNPGTNGLVHIDNGSAWTAAGNVNSAKGHDRLVVSGGSRLDVAGSITFLMTNSHIVVTDPGSFLSVSNNTFQTAFASSFTVTNGASAYLKSVLLNDNAASAAADITVAGTGSLLEVWSEFCVGSRTTNAVLRIVDGGAVAMSGSANFYLGGKSAACSNCWVLVSGEGSTLSVPNLYGGWNSASQTNALLATDGALVDVRTRLNSYKDTSYRFENGAALQFHAASPNFSMPSPELCVFDGSSLSFAGVSDADVRCSTAATHVLRDGYRCTYAGDVGFRLAGATNLNSAAQGYTFAADASHPEHFARLEFIGGSATNLYRGRAGDSVSIGTADAPDSGALVARDSDSIVALPFEAYGPVSLRNATISFTQGASFHGPVAVDLAALPELPGGAALLNVEGDLDLDSRFVFTGVPESRADIPLVAYTGDLLGGTIAATGVPGGYSLSLQPGRKRIILSNTIGTTVVLIR